MTKTENINTGTNSSSSRSVRMTKNSSRQLGSSYSRRVRQEKSSSLLRSVFAAWHMYVLIRRGFRDTTRRRRKKSSGTTKKDERKMSKTSGPLSFRDLHHTTTTSRRSHHRPRRRSKERKSIEHDYMDSAENDILVETILRKNRGELFSEYSSSHERRRHESKRSSSSRSGKRKKKWEPISLLVRRKLPSPLSFD